MDIRRLKASDKKFVQIDPTKYIHVLLSRSLAITQLLILTINSQAPKNLICHILRESIIYKVTFFDLVACRCQIHLQ